MTNEEAIKIINNMPNYKPWEVEALALAIKALEREPCEDCVDREVLRKNMHYIPIAPIMRDDDVIYRNVVFSEVIDFLPSVKPQRAKGHLISNQQDGEVKAFWERYRCSVCGEYAQDNFNYCSRCGAELEGEEE
jgi:hypothetical protein